MMVVILLVFPYYRGGVSLDTGVQNYFENDYTNNLPLHSNSCMQMYTIISRARLHIQPLHSTVTEELMTSAPNGITFGAKSIGKG